MQISRYELLSKYKNAYFIQINRLEGKKKKIHQIPMSNLMQKSLFFCFYRSGLFFIEFAENTYYYIFEATKSKEKFTYMSMRCALWWLQMSQFYGIQIFIVLFRSNIASITWNDCLLHLLKVLSLCAFQMWCVRREFGDMLVMNICFMLNKLKTSCRTTSTTCVY